MIYILLKIVLSFIISVLFMMIAYYTHLRLEYYTRPDFDKSSADKLGLVYSRIVGPLLWLVILFTI